MVEVHVQDLADTAGRSYRAAAGPSAAVLYARARNWAIGSDPGLLRLRMACRATAAMRRCVCAGGVHRGLYPAVRPTRHGAGHGQARWYWAVIGVLLLRIEETAIGAVIGIAAAMLVLPVNTRTLIRTDTRAFFTTLSS